MLNAADKDKLGCLSLPACAPANVKIARQNPSSLAPGPRGATRV